MTDKNLPTTGVGAGDPPGSVAECRQVIDELDEQLLDLVAQRRLMSSRVQSLRMAGGGTRLELDRENAVLTRYAARFGLSGRDIALAILALCRGPGPYQAPVVPRQDVPGGRPGHGPPADPAAGVPLAAGVPTRAAADAALSGAEETPRC